MPNITKDENTLMVKCACHSHALELTLFDYGKDSVPQIYLAVWSLGQRPLKLRWRDRLRWVWYLLKDGELHGDDVILDEKDAIAIANFLSEKSLRISERIREVEAKYGKKIE